MPQKDTSEIKEKILSHIRVRGPSLPVHVARETGQSVLFASAFLSELLSDKKIKISNMRVGNSPLYLMYGQEPQLEKFSQYLKSKEKEAFSLLKEKKFLKDKEQDPAIRVALRQIKDFAVPFQNGDELFWRYFIISESEFHGKDRQEKQKEAPEKVETKPIDKEQPKKKSGEELDIFDSRKKTKSKKKKPSTKQPQRNDKLFNKVKEYLAENQQEILDIEEVSRAHIILRVRNNSEEYLVVAYNKKRIGEEEINKAFKKASELNLPYKVLGLGEPLKKLESLIKAVEKLRGIEKI
jgi:hypothetical protein